MLSGSLIFCHLAIHRRYYSNCARKIFTLQVGKKKSYTYTNSVSFLTLAGKGNVPDHGKRRASRGDLTGLGKKPQKGVALSNVTPFTR